MNLFARILSHGFALVVVALLALGLIYRGELFPEWELPEFLAPGHKPAVVTTEQGQAEAPPAEAGVAVGDGSAQEVDITPAAQEGTGVTEPEVTGQPGDAVVQAPGVAAVEAPTAAETVPEAAPEAVLAEALPAESEAAGTEETVAEEATGAAAPQADMTTSEAVVPAPADAGEEVVTAPDAATSAAKAHPESAVTPYRILAAAREAYWLRDYAVAEQKYQELIALDPDNPDGYGELGNMYFSQGDWDKASASYYDAGQRLVSQGMYDRARQLAEVIRGLNGSQADDLEQQINAAESAAP